MKDIEYNRMTTLLKSSKDSLAMECLDRIQQVKPGYTFAKAISADEIFEIYSKRKIWNESLSNPKRNRISGYDQLMIGLPKGVDQKVEIHTLDWPDTTVMIFCDEQMANIFGFLIIPKM